MYYRDHSRHNDVYSKVRRNILPFVCIGLEYFSRECGSTFGCVELEYFSRECGSTFGCISGDFVWAIIFHKSSAPPWEQTSPLIVDLFLSSYEAEFIQNVIKDKKLQRLNPLLSHYSLPPAVCRRAPVLFTLFVFVCA